MVSINFMEIQMGGGVFELGNPGGRGGEKTVPSVVGLWRDFFWNNPITLLIIVLADRMQVSGHCHCRETGVVKMRVNVWTVLVAFGER